MPAGAKKWFMLTAAMAALALFGCAATGSDVKFLQSELDKKDKLIEELTMQNRQKDQEISTYKEHLDLQRKAAIEAQMRAENLMMQTTTEEGVITGGILLPLDAKPGECYARVFVPPKYTTITEEVLTEGASERIEIIPAKYKMVEEKVLVKEASARMETIPAQYDWVEEEVLVKPAHSAWKKGRGLMEKVDNTTGEIMCLVNVPAEYKNIRKKVMVKPPGTRVINVPAAYETIKVRRLESAAQENLVQIPAKYQAITRTEKISEGAMEWHKVMCETNLTSDLVLEVQTALKNAGHDPGPIDGIMGRLTRGALNSYQKEKGLAIGALTYQTIESLGIMIPK